MKVKKSFENMIRGWLPKEQNIRYYQNNSPTIENTKVLLKPNSSMLDIRFQRNFGIAIGLGLGVILVGLIGWMSVNQTYNSLTSYFSYAGLDASRYYLFNDLIEQKAFFLMLIAIGVITALLSVLIFKNCSIRELFSSNGPHARLGNGLISGGGATVFLSFRNLFLFILAPNNEVLNHGNLQLELFIVFFIIGASLITTGILTLRRTT